MPRVIISSGHTSQDPGTKANDLVEYEVARKIAKAVVPLLRQHGIITLAVPADLDLLKRIDWINKTNYDESTNDVAIEIHVNEGGKSGIESWYEGEGESKSKQLSEFLLKQTSKETGLPEQGAKSEYEHEIGSIAFLHDVNSVTSLIECGYIDNEEDSKFLKEENNIQKIAKGITKGVLEYFGLEYRETSVPTAAPTSSDFSRPNTPPVRTPAIQPQNNTPRGLGTSFPSPSMPSADLSTGFERPQFPTDNPFNAQPSTSGSFMSRDNRKKMIEEMYVKVLGREPNQNDLNYFLNTGISEQELLRKMVDSQEHADLVKSRQEVIKAKDELIESKTELITLRNSTEDQKVIIRNLHTLIAQKNQALAQLQQQVTDLQNQQLQQTQNQASQTRTSPTKYKGTFLDKVFKAFSDIFE